LECFSSGPQRIVAKGFYEVQWPVSIAGVYCSEFNLPLWSPHCRQTKPLP
jgi:hypothetical protein